MCQAGGTAAPFIKLTIYVMKNTDTKSSIQPLADRVLVKRVDNADTKTASGIFIPETAQKEKSKIGTVIAVGPGRTTDDGKLVPMSIKVGAKVIFNSGWDNEVKIGSDDSEYFLVKEADILALTK